MTSITKPQMSTRLPPADSLRRTCYMDFLPPELLAEIFAYCLPYGRNSQPTLRQDSVPVVLCNVCRTWREVALGHSNLWTDLVVEGKGEDDIGSADVVERLQDWFGRAGRRPLSLTIRTLGPAGTKEPEDTGPVDTSNSPVGIFSSPLLQRVRDLALELQSFTSLKALPVGHFPFLESLVVRYTPSVSVEHHDRSTPALTCFDASPSIRRVCFYDFVPIALPWSQLTHLVLCFAINSAFYANVMSSCINLQCAVLIERMTSPNELALSPAKAPATLPHLHDLEVAIFPPSGEDEIGRLVLYPTIFRFCTLPGLKSLRLLTASRVGAFNPSNWPESWRKAFYANLGSLRRLTLNIHPLSETHYRDLFGAAGNLEVLALELYNSLNQLKTIKDALMVEGGQVVTLSESDSVHDAQGQQKGQPLLPKLKIIRCRAPTISDDFSFITQDDYFAKLVQSRTTSPSCARIEKVVLVSAETSVLNDVGIRKRACKYFEESVANGMEVEFLPAERIWYDGVIFSNDWSEAPSF
ncbi:hypothetical protein FA15DRAFT_754181 [Coprinopsis marcescibilis]|uniref:Uncharacterized protein n=1 Tax=Coprinopsis marcescibilis TaxID=230819 RepID=A0A5C3L3P1_COPMA|nr:hypothetical protein FA15DRAFT_754181 [Coprinopsis marcescibilis]